MRSFQEMLDCTSDAELGRMCRDRFNRMADAVARGIDGAVHPGAQWNADNRILRDHARAAKDGSGSGLGARNLEESDQPGAQDDPPRTPGTPEPPERNGAAAQDAANDAAVRAAILGLDRLHGPYGRRDTRRVDEDGIVQGAPRSW